MNINMSHGEQRGEFFNYTPKETSNFARTSEESAMVSGEINTNEEELTQPGIEIPKNPTDREAGNETVDLDMDPNNPKRLEDWIIFIQLQGLGELLDNETKKKLIASEEEISLGEFIKSLERTQHSGNTKLNILHLTGKLGEIMNGLQKE